jgi:hypothetical protein
MYTHNIWKAQYPMPHSVRNSISFMPESLALSGQSRKWQKVMLDTVTKVSAYFRRHASDSIPNVLGEGVCDKPLPRSLWRALPGTKVWYAMAIPSPVASRHCVQPKINGPQTQSDQRDYRSLEVENATGNPGNGTVLDPSLPLRPGRIGCGAIRKLTAASRQALNAKLSESSPYIQKGRGLRGIRVKFDTCCTPNLK